MSAGMPAATPPATVAIAEQVKRDGLAELLRAPTAPRDNVLFVKLRRPRTASA